MRPVKILLLCSSRLALPALQELAFFHLLAAVVIPAQCDEMIDATRFALTGSGVPILVVDKDSYVNQIKESIDIYEATLGLIITFSYLIPSSVYTLTQSGFYNIHPGPLPEYRGADPIFQQVKNKEKQAGLTIHKLSEGYDKGPVVMKEMIRLEPTDTYGMLTTKLAIIAARLSTLLVKLISFEVAVPSREQDELKATYFKKQAAIDVSINWQMMDGISIIALVNACNPWNKGASTKITNKIIRILEAEQITLTTFTGNTLPGTIVHSDEKGLVVSTLNNEWIRVKIIHADEGFLSASRLMTLGVVVGSRFEMI